MKRILISTGLLSALALALLSLAAFSQNDRAQSANTVRKGTPPEYCHPCLFYGGDFDPNGPSPGGFYNSDSLRVVSAVYVPFYVPSGQKWTVTGLFSNHLSDAPSINPAQIEWSISSGVSAGNPGTLIASGTAYATWTPTGRTWDGFIEYTALGHLTPTTAVTLTSGVYWMTAVPVCTAHLKDGMCQNGVYLMSDVNDVPPPNSKGVQPNNQAYVNDPAQGQNFARTWPPFGPCHRFSAGLLGHAQPNG